MVTYTATIPRRAQVGPARLSYPQERMFLLDRIMPGLAAYNVPTFVRVRAHIDPALLAGALERIVARHEVLRTHIALVDGMAVAEVAPEGEVQLTVEDLRELPESERHAAAQARLGELAARPFDLAADTLLRVGLAHVGEQEDLLLVVFHHLASDHVSSGLLFAELEAVYGALRAGREPDLPELPVQYGDFAEWQREHLSGKLLDDLLAYWTKQLAGAPDRLD